MLIFVYQEAHLLDLCVDRILNITNSLKHSQFCSFQRIVLQNVTIFVILINAKTFVLISTVLLAQYLKVLIRHI
jgi:hypothetical protein